PMMPTWISRKCMHNPAREPVPISDDSPQSGSLHPSPPAWRILVVEDDLVLMEYLVKTLAKAGYIPVQASQAKQALLTLAREPIDLVLTDLMMPSIDGLEMLELIRHNPKFARLPILICSAAKDQQHVMIAAKFNIQGYLLKPIDRQNLLGRIATIL